MTESNIQIGIRTFGTHVIILDIQGDVTGAAENTLSDAYTKASAARSIILNFSGLEYMNSSGIGLLVTLLIRAQRQGQKLMAFGLSEHYQEIFELTRLNEAIILFANEQDALASPSNVHS